jgi:hypothetical protein
MAKKGKSKVPAVSALVDAAVPTPKTIPTEVMKVFLEIAEDIDWHRLKWLSADRQMLRQYVAGEVLKKFYGIDTVYDSARYSIEEVCRLLGRKASAIRKAVNRRQFPRGFRVGRRVYYLGIDVRLSKLGIEPGAKDYQEKREFVASLHQIQDEVTFKKHWEFEKPAREGKKLSQD